MVVYHEKLFLTSISNEVSYFEITDKVRRIIKESDITNGTCVVFSPHTTCSVFFEEYSHDVYESGEEYLQADLNNILNKLIPRCLSKGQYNHPGPKHTKFGESVRKQEMKTSETGIESCGRSFLNTDAHLKATIIGSSETFIVTESQLQVGQFGYIYFVDWDQNRARDRQCLIQVTGE